MLLTETLLCACLRMAMSILYIYWEEFEENKGVAKCVNRRTDNAMVKRKRKTGQTTIYKTIHRKLKIEQHESY